MKHAALVILALAVATPARAFVRTQSDPSNPDSPCLFWGQRTVPYQISQRGDETSEDQTAVYAAVRTSLEQWTDVSCSDFTYQDNGLTTSTQSGFSPVLANQPALVGDVNGHNVILFRNVDCAAVVDAGDPCTSAANDDCQDYYDCWNYGGAVIALTTTTFDYQTGQLFDADIELDAANFHFTTIDPGLTVGSCPSTGPFVNCVATDVRNTVTHESGHMLGLGHSADSTATMYFSASPGETTKRDLAPDDISGICAIYPTGAAVVTCNEPTATSKSGCGCTDVSGLSPALAGVLLFLRRRKAKHSA